MNNVYLLSFCLYLVFSSISYSVADAWTIEGKTKWQQATKQHKNLVFEKSSVMLAGNSGYLQSNVKRFVNKRKAKSIILEQTANWHNWQESEHIGPVNLLNAPVFISKGDNDYWLFGLYGESNKKQNYIAETVTLPGFDIPLQTTPFPNQYDAPGGLKESLQGYHAWQSRDMKNWVHHGPITDKTSRWVTSAEYLDGKTYIFYDYPNDQDPHLFIDEDLTDGQLGESKGLIFNDPSNGSDTAFFFEDDGSLHVIYEDWTPINAKEHAWDSPLAGHAVSKDGFNNFEILAPAVDLRTTPTGKTRTHLHPHWQQHPDWDTNIAQYQEHLPIQDAFGDWAMIKVGKQYYLFGDYDHAEHSVGNGNSNETASENMTIARFTSDNLNKEFTLVGDFGKTGHPDPDIGFAKGRFYLITQTKDFVSSGPWVDTVSARVGVDTTNNGHVDTWTAWQRVFETYQQNPKFSKHVEVTPAQLDLTDLPAGYGFSFEIKVAETDTGIMPELSKVKLIFQ